MISIALIDDHPMVLDGMKRVIEAQGDLAVVGQESHGDRVLGLLEKTRVDVVVVDLNVPGLNGLSLIERIRIEYPAVKIVVFSSSPEEHFGVRLLRAGVMSYISKARPTVDLLTAIRRAAQGQRFLTEALAERLVSEPTTASGDPKLLSNRELEVLRLLASGRQPSEISSQLSIGPSTVSSHLSNIREKLDTRTNSELIRVALAQRLIE